MVAVDDLVLGHELGEGGAATVYAARWRGREVSAKVARGTGDVAGDVHAEARVLQRVSHPALLEVLGIGRLPDGRAYLLLPRLRGEDLAARLADGPLPVARALEVVAAVGGALTALHDAGVLHRDLKPENVFLADDGVFLLDLGLARDIAVRTASLRIRGTYDAMAPERLYGEPASIASEVYELAALAWAALAGDLPWPAGAAPSARRWIPALDVDDDAAAALEAVLRRALSTIPERRPASAAQLVRALHDAHRAPHIAGRDRRTAELAEPDEPGRVARGSSPTGIAPSPVVGHIVAETYRLVSVLGTGGAGTVFAAEHLRLPRRFAIKILQPDSDDPDARARFRREAEIVASLSDPHIVEVFDYDLDEHGVPFMVMELLEGETLRDRLRRGALAVAEVVELIRQTAGAVAVAHARGVVHRDLKPSNLFLRRGDRALDVQVVDFGISKVLGDHPRTATGLILGSPGYAAPEQIRNDAAIGPATDVFALAAIAYEALSGARAFDATSREGVLNQILHGAPRPLHQLGVARAIAEVVHAGLAKRPERRPASAAAFAAALATAAGAQPPPRAHRRSAGLAASAIAVLAVPALVVVGLVDRSRVRTAAGEPAAFIAAPPDAAPAALPPIAAPPAAAPAAQAEIARPPPPPVASAPPARSELRLAIRPSTARVVIDGTPVYGTTIFLTPGRHDLRITAPGYQSVLRVVDPRELDGELRVQLHRTRAPAQRPRALRDLLED